MKKDNLSQYVTDIDDRYIRESASARETEKVKKSGFFVITVKIAACIMLTVGISAAAFLLPQMKKGENTPSDNPQGSADSDDTIDIGNTVDRDSESIRYIDFRLRNTGLYIPSANPSSSHAFRVADTSLTDYKATVIRSADEFNKYLEDYSTLLINMDYVSDPRAYNEFEARYTVYDPNFFETHDLIILPILDGSTSTKFKVKYLAEIDGEPMLCISYGCPDPCEEAVQYFTMAIETEQKLESDGLVSVKFTNDAQINEETPSFEYYEIDTTVDGTNTPLVILRSKQDIKDFLARFPETEDAVTLLSNHLAAYGDDFFKSNHIVIVSTTLPTSMITDFHFSVSESWSSLNVTLHYTVPKGEMTDDILPLTAVIPMSGQLASDAHTQFHTDEYK